jgi:hypothetical protein
MNREDYEYIDRLLGTVQDQIGTLADRTVALRAENAALRRDSLRQWQTIILMITMFGAACGFTSAELAELRRKTYMQMAVLHGDQEELASSAWRS